MQAARFDEAPGTTAGALNDVTSGSIEMSAVSARRFAAAMMLALECPRCTWKDGRMSRGTVGAAGSFPRSSEQHRRPAGRTGTVVDRWQKGGGCSGMRWSGCHNYLLYGLLLLLSVRNT
jgi:hypothetical protein